jgi:hypothetical protein
MKRKRSSKFTKKKKQRTNKTKKTFNYWNGCTEYMLNGELHRTNGPASICRDITRWYKNGKLHRVNGPALIYHPCNIAKWYVNDLLHRDNDLPAIEQSEAGRYEWFQRGVRHRENNQPTFVDRGSTLYCRYGDYHRLDGPAVSYKLYGDEFYIYGRPYDEIKFNRVTNNVRKMIRNIKMKRFIKLCRSKEFNEYFYAEGRMGRKWDIKKIENLDYLIE